MIPGIQGIHPVIGAAAANPVGTGPTSTYVAAGAYSPDTTVAVASPGYPAGILANDILILHVHLDDGLGNASITGVTGSWTLLDSVPYINDDTAAVYWKRANGFESGTETVTVSESVNSGVIQAMIYSYRGCIATGTPYEAAANNAQTPTTSHVGSGITTLGPNRRVVTLFGCTQANTTGANTNGWTEDSENSTAFGNDACINANSIEKAGAGAVAACTRTQGIACRNVSFTFALIPAPAS